MIYIFKNIEYDVPKPKYLDLLLNLARKLSKPFKHVRVDFFVVNEKLYFSELTFTTSNGMDFFSPKEWDYKFGELLELPKDKKMEYDVMDKDAIFYQTLNLEPIVSKYKELEIEVNYKEKYKKLKDSFFALLGFFNEEDYFTLIILGLKIVFKKNKKIIVQNRPTM